MSAIKHGILIGVLLAGGVPISLAQLEVGGGLLDNCAEIDPLQSAGNFAEARDKARLCLEGIEQELVGEVGQYFLPQIGLWTRTSFQQDNVMGFTNITAVYEKGDISVDVSLTGESGGGGGGGGFAAGLGGLLGGIAQSAILQSGQQVTVAGLPSSVQPDGTLTVPLEDGSFLTFVSPDLGDADAALSGMGDLVNDFPVAEINAALL